MKCYITEIFLLSFRPISLRVISHVVTLSILKHFPSSLS